jgi:predicted ATP-dependent endonuclease of OLD family
MIKTLIINNYRSIEHAEINLGPMNAFIGRNNAGKSNIMKALNIVLGEVYPGIRSFNDKDFCDYNKANAIHIEVRFDTPLLVNTKVYGFRLTYNGQDCDYVAIDQSGNTVTYSSYGREVRVSNDMKDEVALMYLGLERQASQQIRSTQWTLYGKLLRHIEKQISETKKAKFKSGIESTYKSHIQPELQQLEEILRAHVKRQTGLEFHLRLSILDPIETIKNLRPYLQAGSSREFDAEDMGAGTQSALAIAIARAYAEIVKHPLVLAIEEPELYLHPHGCRHFRRLLEELSENGIQVIYTTHERSFVDLGHFQNIHLVKKESATTEVFSGIDHPITSGDILKLVSKFDDEVNEVYFANKVVLVEGPADRISCELALEKLGMEIDRESVSITECGGSGDMKAIAEVLKVFGISTHVLIDEDPGNVGTAAIITELKKLLGAKNVLLQSPKLEGMLGLQKKPSKAEAMKTLPQLFETTTMPMVYTKLMGELTEKLDTISKG